MSLLKKHAASWVAKTPVIQVEEFAKYKGKFIGNIYQESPEKLEGDITLHKQTGTGEDGKPWERYMLKCPGFGVFMAPSSGEKLAASFTPEVLLDCKFSWGIGENGEWLRLVVPGAGFTQVATLHEAETAATDTVVKEIA